MSTTSDYEGMEREECPPGLTYSTDGDDVDVDSDVSATMSDVYNMTRQDFLSCFTDSHNSNNSDEQTDGGVRVLVLVNNAKTHERIERAMIDHPYEIPDMSNFGQRADGGQAPSLTVKLQAESDEDWLGLEHVVNACQLVRRTDLPVHTLQIRNIDASEDLTAMSEASRLLSVAPHWTPASAGNGTDGPEVVRRAKGTPWQWVEISPTGHSICSPLQADFFTQLSQRDEFRLVEKLSLPSERDAMSTMVLEDEWCALNHQSGIIYHIDGPDQPGRSTSGDSELSNSVNSESSILNDTDPRLLTHETLAGRAMFAAGVPFVLCGLESVGFLTGYKPEDLAEMHQGVTKEYNRGFDMFKNSAPSEYKKDQFWGPILDGKTDYEQRVYMVTKENLLGLKENIDSGVSWNRMAWDGRVMDEGEHYPGYQTSNEDELSQSMGGAGPVKKE